MPAWLDKLRGAEPKPVTTRAEGEQLLRQMLGPDVSFREGQWEAVDQVANHRKRLLVVQRTGWGKSVVYFLATKILRGTGAGPSLLISPLLALMRNQLAMAERLGLRPATIHSENVEAWESVEKALTNNECDLLLVSPERLGNAAFLDKLLPMFQGRIGLFVVDEAHCISDWGHDFRPDYRRIVRILRLLPAGVPILGTTATANDRVVRDVRGQIPKLEILRGPLIRHSLKLFNIALPDQASRLAWLARFVPELPGSGIIYCLTIQDTRRVAQWLRDQGIRARAYHSELAAAERVEAEQSLLDNQVKALVATVALGMGFDKPDLGFVVHFQRPGSVVAYYQQVGRAGRAVASAFGILLNGREDDEIQDYFIRTAFPPLEVLEGAVRVLEEGGEMTLDHLAARLNYSRAALEKALRLLEVDGIVQRREKWHLRTANAWRPDLARAEHIAAQRRAELEQMRRYVAHPGCLMEFLARALDDPAPQRCGKCMNCRGQVTRRPPPEALVRQAACFLRGDALVWEPRGRWPSPVVEEIRQAWPEAVDLSAEGLPKVTIPERLRTQPGRILCVYGDAGWGPEIEEGKYRTGIFSEALVQGAAELVQQKWRPDPAPAWVAAVPSLRRERLVRDFAERLAARLGVPFVAALRKAKDTPPQKQMHNSVMQLRNMLGAFAVQTPLPPGPVLLVDDVVDSGWTLTLLAVLLRQHGSGPVYPFALAKASPRGG